MGNALSRLKSNKIEVIIFSVTQMLITIFKMKQNGVESEMSTHIFMVI